MVKAAIFDFDGTLIDSEPYYDASFRSILERRGAKINKNLLSLHGVGISGTINVLKQHYPGTTDWDDFGKEFFNSFRECTMKAPLFEGVTNLLQALHAQMPLAICSNSPRKIVSEGLEQKGINKYFGVVLTREDFVKLKPDPEPYYKTCERLKIAPEECVVFEDSLIGLAAAKAANCKTVLFNSNKYPVEAITNADFVTTSYGSITPQLVNSL